MYGIKILIENDYIWLTENNFESLRPILFYTRDDALNFITNISLKNSKAEKYK